MTVPMGLSWEFGPGVDQGDDVHLLASYLFPVKRFERDASIAKGRFKV
jgi:hypothetical protein